MKSCAQFCLQTCEKLCTTFLVVCGVGGEECPTFRVCLCTAAKLCVALAQQFFMDNNPPTRNPTGQLIPEINLVLWCSLQGITFLTRYPDKNGVGVARCAYPELSSLVPGAAGDKQSNFSARSCSIQHTHTRTHTYTHQCIHDVILEESSCYVL